MIWLRIAIPLAILLSCSFASYKIGVKFERQKWEEIELSKDIEINRLNTIAKDQTNDNVQLALKIEVVKNDKDKEINDMRKQLIDAERLHGTAKLCKKRVPKVSNPSVSTASTEESDGLSGEFQEFLNTELARADQIRTYATTAHEWAQKICESKEVICGN